MTGSIFRKSDFIRAGLRSLPRKRYRPNGTSIRPSIGITDGNQDFRRATTTGRNLALW